MSKIKFLTAAVIALVLLNIGMVSFFLLAKMPPRHEGPRKIIIERLHFDAEQIAKYDKLIAQHRTDIRQKESTIGQVNQQFFGQLKGDDFSRKDSLLAQIGLLQQAVAQIHLDHFKDIKSICKGNQLHDFDTLVGELAKFFTPQPGKKNK